MIQLVAYRCAQEGGARLGVLPNVKSFTTTSPLNDISSLTFTYPRQGINVEWLDNEYFEIGIEVDFDGNGSYYEYPNHRYISTGQSDEGSEPAGDLTLTLASYAWMLNAALVWSINSLNSDGNKEFTNATAGGIMKYLLDDNKARGWGTQFTYSFSATLDSAGQPWGTLIPKIEYEPSLSVFSVLNSLTEQGLCDWVMDGRELRLYRPYQQLAVDRSDLVILRYGADFLDGPNRIEKTNLRHQALVTGDGKALAIIDQAVGTPAPWGKWFTAVDQSGASEEGTLSLLAADALAGAKLPTTQLTRSMSLPVRSTVLSPLVSYRSGDYISAPNALGVQDKLRVRDIGLNYDSGNYTAILTLNDRILENEIRLARRVTGITRGAKPGGPGGPSRRDDKRTPKPPTGVAVGSDVYLDRGNPRGRVSVSWSAVIQATDNTGMDIKEYEVYTRKTGEDARLMTTTSERNVVQSGYIPGDTWYFQVRAKGHNDKVGAFSSWVSVVVADDITPPGRPSTPTVVSSFGTLKVTWNGKEDTGAAQPTDYVDTILHVSATNNFTPSTTTAYDTFTGAGSSYIGDVPYGQTRYVKLVSRDRAGNESPASVQVAATQEEALGTIELGGHVIRVGSIDYTKLRMGQGNLIVDPTFSNTTINGYRSAYLPAKIGIFKPSSTYPAGAAFVTDEVARLYFGVAATGMTSDHPMEVTPGAKYLVRLKVERMAGTGTHVVNLHWITSTGTITGATVASGTASQDVSAVWTAPADAVAALMWFRNLSAGMVSRVRNPLFAEQTSGVLIQDDAISAPKIIAGAIIAEKIAANAIVADKIAANAITAGKIAAGAVTANTIDVDALNGKVITGSTVQTSTTGARIVINSTGIRHLDSGGNNLSQWTPTGFILRGSRTGSRLEITDSGIHQYGDTGGALSSWTPNVFSFKSGTSGARVELTSNAIRVYNEDNQPTFLASAATGGLDIAGTFRTNPAGVFPRTEITNTNQPNGMYGISFIGQSGLSAYPYIRGTYTTTTNWATNSLVLGSGMGASATQLVLSADGAVWVGNAVRSYGMMVSGSPFNWLFLRGEQVLIQGRLVLTEAAATTVPANLYWGGGEVFRVTSLSRHKLDQRPLGTHYEVLDLTAKTWVDRGFREANPDYHQRTAGFVAEEVEALSIANGGVLDPLLDRDENGELRGFNYDRLAAALIPVIRDMNERLTALEGAQ